MQRGGKKAEKMYDLNYCLTEVKALRARGSHLTGIEMNSSRKPSPISSHYPARVMNVIYLKSADKSFLCISKVA